MRRYLWVYAMIMFTFCSCKKEQFKRVIITDNKTEITIEGEKDELALEWTVSIQVKSEGFSDGTLSFQIYCDSLENNIKIDWLNPENAIISFVEKDGLRKFKLIASRKQIFLAEIK